MLSTDQPSTGCSKGEGRELVHAMLLWPLSSSAAARGTAAEVVTCSHVVEVDVASSCANAEQVVIESQRTDTWEGMCMDIYMNA